MEARRNKFIMIEKGDRISSLPDCILQHILSFIPTIDAVHTCLLSKRWRYIWKGIPKLYFDNSCFRNINFLNFLETVVSLHDTTIINEFFLNATCSEDFNDKDRIEALISSVLGKDLQKLYIKADLISPIDFPSTLYVSESLVSLKLDLCSSGLELPASVSFPNLKVVHFEEIEFQCEEGVTQVSFTCPVLKELLLINVEGFDYATTLSIFAPLLEMMELHDVRMSCLDCDYCEIKIYADSLKALSLDTSYLDLSLTYVVSLYNLSPLPEARIDFYEDDLSLVSKLFQGISNVKQLTVSCSTIANLLSSKDLPVFIHLNKLIVTGCVEADLSAELLVGCLCSLPHVESLIFDKGLYGVSHEDYDWTVAIVPQTFMSHLKSFEIREFKGEEFELSFVEFMQKNARAIEKMFIVSSCYLSRDPKKQFDVMKRLLLLQTSVDFS